MKYINIKSAKIYFTFIMYALVSTAMAESRDDFLESSALSGIISLNDNGQVDTKKNEMKKNKNNKKKLMNELKVESKWTPGMCAKLCRSESCLKAGSVLSMSDMATICAKKCKASPEIILSCVVPAYQKYCRYDDKAIKTQSCTELSNANSAILQWFYVKGYVEKTKKAPMDSADNHASNSKIVEAWNTFFDEVRKKKADLRGKEQLTEEDVKNHMKEVKKVFAERFKGKDFKNDSRARENAKKLLLKEISDAEKQMQETKSKRSILENEIAAFSQIQKEAQELKRKLDEKEALVKEQQVLVENLEKADDLRSKLKDELKEKLQRLNDIDLAKKPDGKDNDSNMLASIDSSGNPEPLLGTLN